MAPNTYVVVSDNNEKGGLWSCGGLMPQCRGMLEQWAGSGWMDGEHPHRGTEERGEVDGMGYCGGVTRKGNII